MHEFLEQRAVVHERLSQFLGVGLTRVFLMGLSSGMRGPVVLNDLRMVRGNELGTFTEVLHRVATIVHHVCD
jgi:hypothetical protein